MGVGVGSKSSGFYLLSRPGAPGGRPIEAALSAVTCRSLILHFIREGGNFLTSHFCGPFPCRDSGDNDSCPAQFKSCLDNQRRWCACKLWLNSDAFSPFDIRYYYHSPRTESSCLLEANRYHVISLNPRTSVKRGHQLACGYLTLMGWMLRWMCLQAS